MTRHYDLQARAAAEAEYYYDDGRNDAHTPGPWRMEDHDDEIDIYGPDDELIANQRHPDDLTGRADFRLMSAAPDLLAACESALGHMEDDNPELYACEGCVAVVHALGAALAKARGEVAP